MSRKYILLLSIFFIVIYGARAQEHIVEGATPNLHLSHKVAAKETWYSIGRMYNLAPKDIAAYNQLSLAKPLEIGQQVRVPLTPANFSQDAVKAGGEAFVPVYHVVQPKEWLYRISVNHNKVPVASLQKWNNISKDGAKPGMKLIVGYLKVKDANATLATSSAPEEKNHGATSGSATPAGRNTGSSPVAGNKTNADNKTVAGNKTVTDNKAAAGNQPAADNKPVTETVKTAGGGKEGSYFRSLYEEGGKSGSGVAGIFKSTSGWNDGKYYALMSNVPVGTIMKITLAQTSKTIYAKVLGELPDMRESAGLTLRISDAAARELGAADDKFSVDMKY